MANQRVEYQDMIDLDGYRKAVADSRSDYKAFADEVNRLNDLMQKSALQVRNELENLIKANAQASTTKEQEAVGQRAATLTAQYRDQKAVLEALAKTESLYGDVTKNLISRQEQLITQYASIEGSSAKEIATKKRLAAEMVNLQGQLDRVSKSTKIASEGATQVTGQYNRLQKELTDARSALKNLDNAFDSNTKQINQNNAEAVRLSTIINRNDHTLRQYDETFKLHNRNIGNYPKNTEGVISSLAGMATGFLTLDAAFGAVKHITELTADFQKYQTVLTNTLGSQQAAADAMDMVQRVAAKTPSSVNELTESYVKLANRGFVATEQELIKLADLAASTGKPFDQLVEAILDAQTGEFERLKEFGITARKSGDAINFSFKGQTTTVKATGSEIQKYILSLGELKGVAGSTAAISATLTGQISNLGDAGDSFLRRVGNKLAPLIGLVISAATSALGKLSDMLKSSSETSKDSLSVYEDQVKAVKSLNTEIVPLLDRYDQLTEKAKQVGGESNLTKKEQTELRKAIDDVAGVIPSAITAQNQYGKVMSINTTLARDYITEQERIAKVLNADSIKKYNDSLALTKKRMSDLQQQLVLVQAATPTPNGGPAVSAPSNQGQSTGFKLQGLSEETKVSEIGRIKKELAAANEEAKNLSATIDYLSGKAPKPKPATPPIKPANTLLGTGNQADKQLKESIDQAKKEAQTTASALESTYEAGGISEIEYLNKRLTILQDGVLKEQDLLRKAGKENTAEYLDTQKELNDIASDYLSKRNALQDKAFNAVVDSVKHVIEVDTVGLKGSLSTQLSGIQSAYQEQESAILTAVSKRQMSETNGEQLLYNLKIKLLQDVAQATADNSKAITKMTEDRLDLLAAELRSEGVSEIEITKALEEERAKILKQREDQAQKSADDTVKINDEKNKKVQSSNANAAKATHQIETTYADLQAQRDQLETDRKDAIAKGDIARAEAVAAQIQAIDLKTRDKRIQIAEMAGQLLTQVASDYVSTIGAYRDQEISALEKQKDYELSLAGDNATAKANITQKYAQKELEIRRKQAIAEKAAALFSVAIQTTLNAVKVGVAEPILLALTIALGAVSAAAIAAKPLPQFFRGTSDAPEGPAWVGEQGFELIESKKGGKPYYRLAAEKQITYLNQHDKVYTHQESKRMIEVNNQIAHEVRSAPGGSLYQPPVIKAGASASEMQQAFEAALDNRPVQEMHWDEKGYQVAIRKNQIHRTWLKDYFSLPKTRR